jgi:hypothetical protein
MSMSDGEEGSRDGRDRMITWCLSFCPNGGFCMAGNFVVLLVSMMGCVMGVLIGNLWVACDFCVIRPII